MMAKRLVAVLHMARLAIAAIGAALASCGVRRVDGGGGEAAGHEVAEEGDPGRSGLPGGDLQAEDLAVALGVDAGGDHGGDLDDPAALADLQHQRVSSHERVRPGIQGPGPERGHLFVQVRSHHRHLRLRQPGDAQGGDELVHAAGGDSEQVAGRHHRGQGCLRELLVQEQFRVDTG